MEIKTILVARLVFLRLGCHAMPVSSLRCVWWWRLITVLPFPGPTTRSSALVPAKTWSQASPLACSPSSVQLTLKHLFPGTPCFLKWSNWPEYFFVDMKCIYEIRGIVSEALWMLQRSSSAKRSTAACCPWSLSTRWRRMASWSWALATGSNQ